MLLVLLRLTLVFVLLIIASILGLLRSIIYPFSWTNGQFFAALVGPLSLKILGVDWSFEGSENLKPDRPCIYVGNHQTNYDLFLACAIRPKKAVGLGKVDLLWIPLFGLFFWLSGNILINRHNRAKAMKSMQKVKTVLTDKGLSIIIMPEGTRSQGKGLQPFKKGAFITAIETKVPIVPICFSSWHEFIDISRWKSGAVKIQCLPEIATADLTSDQLLQLVEKSHTLMQQNIQKLNHDLRQEQLAASAPSSI